MGGKKGATGMTKSLLWNGVRLSFTLYILQFKRSHGENMSEVGWHSPTDPGARQWHTGHTHPQDLGQETTKGVCISGSTEGFQTTALNPSPHYFWSQFSLLEKPQCQGHQHISGHCDFQVSAR